MSGVEKKKPPQPTLLDWAKAEERYRQGESGLSVAKLLSVRPETVSRHMKAKGVIKGSRMDAVRQEIEDEVMKAKKEFANKLAGRKVRAKERLYNLSEGATVLFHRSMQAIAKDPDATIVSATSAGKALFEVMKGLNTAYDTFAKILDIKPDEDGGGARPELIVREMSAEAEEALRNAQPTQSELDSDFEITGLADDSDVVDEKPSQ